MAEPINFQHFIKAATGKTGSFGLSSLKRQNQAAEALKKAGFSQTDAKRIPKGLKTGNLKLSTTKAAQVTRALNQAKFFKYKVKDVTGAINRFVKNNSDQTPEIKKNEAEELAKLRKRRLLFRRQESDFSQMAKNETAEKPNDAKTADGQKNFTSPASLAESLNNYQKTFDPVNLPDEPGTEADFMKQTDNPAVQNEPEDLPID